MLVLTLQVSFAQTSGVVAPQSTIEISVRGVPGDDAASISGRYTLAPDGTIRLPYLKSDIKVVGKSQRAVEDALAKEYKDAEIFTAATFNVKIQAVQEITQHFVTVSGGVRNNRSVPWNRDMTLLSAIEIGRAHV